VGLAVAWLLVAGREAWTFDGGRGALGWRALAHGREDRGAEIEAEGMGRSTAWHGREVEAHGRGAWSGRWHAPLDGLALARSGEGLDFDGDRARSAGGLGACDRRQWTDCGGLKAGVRWPYARAGHLDQSINP
jgi:hypothetical protein